VRLGPHKLVVSPKGAELFDLAQDPAEKVDRAAREPELVARLERKLTELEAESIRPSRAATDPETLEMLREGGYLDDGGPAAARGPTP
jgi:hypothetical protein